MDIFNGFIVVTDCRGKGKKTTTTLERFMMHLWFLKDADVSLSLGRKKAASAESVLQSD